MKNNVLLIAVLIVTAFLGFSQYQLRQENNMLRESISRLGMSGGKEKKTDPYIAGPVKNRIVKGSAELKACYKAYLTQNPKKRDGKIKLDWQIDTDGDVIKPEVVFSQFSSDTLGECIIEKINNWEFPNPLVDKYVSHLFQFNDKL